MLKITDENFDTEIKEYNGIVLLEFYSESCIPCKRMSPVLAEIDETHTEVKTAKYNVSTDRKIAEQYKILATPTIILFGNGEEKVRKRGIVKKDEIEEIIKEVLENDCQTS